jgi:uncharacterized protein with NAD-binding domain and iron-sulfur cluster
MNLSDKTRVAIIGGGPAALAAAFELTATPELQARHQITIYQPGWRLGGKCASGRNRKLGHRIEEHGLHVWFGCYDNAFSIMRRCYASLHRDPATQAMPTWRHAFKPCHQVTVWDGGADWQRHVLNFPPTPGEPGFERQRDFVGVLREVLGWIDGRMRRLRVEHHEVGDALEGAPLPAADRLPAACREVGIDVERPEHLGSTYLFEAVARSAERHIAGGDMADAERGVELMDGFRQWVDDQLAQPLGDHGEVHFFAATVDIAAAAVRGILAEGLLLRGFDAINDVELSDWLERHGATIDREAFERNSVFLRGVYDGSFAFVDGDVTRPNMAAGRALQGAVRCLFHYNGAVLWRMQAGMGDAVIAPLYEVLRARGVRFRFFHAVEDVRPSADGARVQEVSVVPQVGLRGDEYEPLIHVPYDAKPLACWPDRPHYDQLVGGRSARIKAADFEHDRNPLGVDERISLLAGRDFDVAVLAVPPPVQEEICIGLRRASPRYAEMLGGVSTVVTQAMQLWLNRSPSELGQDWESNSLMSMFVEPIDTYCDMSHLLAGEHWPASMDVRHIAYFCGVIGHDEVGRSPAAARAVLQHGRGFLERHARTFWPNVATRQRMFDWDRLVAPPEVAGPDRLESQYLRVNHQPTERYVLTLAGSVASRLWPKDRCFENLVLAGDWTRSGFDAGCVEAAMTSGMLAAQAISGWPRDGAIAGLHGPSGFPDRPLLAGDENGGGSGLPLVGYVERVAGEVVAAALGLARRLRRPT